MRVGDGWVVAEPRLPLRVNDAIGYFSKLLNILEAGYEVFLLQKPTSIPVYIRGSKSKLAFGPNAMIIHKESFNEIYEVLKSYLRHYFKVCEDAWVDTVLITKDVNICGEESKDLVGVLGQWGFNITERDSCFLCVKGCEIDERKFKELLNSRAVIFSTSLSLEHEVRNVKGQCYFDYVNHPLIYGVNLGESKFKVTLMTGKLANIIDLLAFPLIYLDDYVLVYEIPYNRSILINFIYEGLNVHKYLLISALIYSCSIPK